MKDGYEKPDFTNRNIIPEAHTIDGKKVAPDGEKEPELDANLKHMRSRPIGLSYPEGQDFGPYVQHCGEGMMSSFMLDFNNGIPFSCGNVHPHTALFLYTLALNQRPTTIVETGTFYGYSTWFLAEALRFWGDDGKIYTIDPEDKLIAKEVKEHPNVEIVTGRSEDVLPDFLDGLDRPIDFAFIDSWKRLALLEFRLIHPHIPEGGLACFHDTQFLNTGKTLYSICREAMENIYEFILFCGTPKKNNPHHFFGNADDRGFFVARKMEPDPFLNVWDANSATQGENLYDLEPVK